MKTNSLSGVVYVSIIVDIDGSIVQMSILRGLHPEADKEALRVLKMTNKKWKPVCAGRYSGGIDCVNMLLHAATGSD